AGVDDVTAATRGVDTVLLAAVVAAGAASVAVAGAAVGRAPPHPAASSASASAPNPIRTPAMLARRRQSPRAALSKRVYGARNTRRFTPMGPLRCLATMISATPRSVDSEL